MLEKGLGGDEKAAILRSTPSVTALQHWCHSLHGPRHPETLR